MQKESEEQAKSSFNAQLQDKDNVISSFERQNKAARE
jgi:hypothetical protein